MNYFVLIKKLNFIYIVTCGIFSFTMSDIITLTHAITWVVYFYVSVKF